MKVRSILINIKVNRFNKRFNRFINKASSKINACTIKDSAIVENHVDASTSTDDLIVKNHIDASAEADTLNNNEPCDNDNEASDNEEKSSAQKLIDQINMIIEASKGFLNNINKIRT